MYAYDFSAVVYDDEIYCIGCLPDGVDVDDDDVHPIFCGSEWDYIPVCCECGEPVEDVTVIEYNK